MAKYRVYIDQIIQYQATIEADSEEEAEGKAMGAAPAHWIEYNRLKAEVRDDLTEKIEGA